VLLIAGYNPIPIPKTKLVGNIYSCTQIMPLIGSCSSRIAKRNHDPCSVSCRLTVRCDKILEATTSKFLSPCESLRGKQLVTLLSALVRLCNPALSEVVATWFIEQNRPNSREVVIFETADIELVPCKA
jgi:hypothetical protein